jgi:hypothetical protein
MQERAIGGGSACGQYKARRDRVRHGGNVPGVTPLFVFIAPPQAQRWQFEQKPNRVAGTFPRFSE